MDQATNRRAETLQEVARLDGAVIYRWISGYSYPRNGNCHNPTPRYVYEKHVNGQVVDVAHRLRDLK